MRARSTIAGVIYEGEVVDAVADRGRLHLTVAFSTFPLIDIGRTVPMLLICSGQDEPAQVEAMLVFDRRDPDRVRCQFDGVLPPESEWMSRRALNERRTIRVRPSPSRPVRARFLGIESAIRVRDLSIGGAGLLVSMETQAELARRGALILSLDLPGIAGPIDFAVRLLYRRLRRDGIAYGVEFDPCLTGSYREKEAMLQRYLLQRQQELVHVSARSQ